MLKMQKRVNFLLASKMAILWNDFILISYWNGNNNIINTVEYETLLQNSTWTWNTRAIIRSLLGAAFIYWLTIYIPLFSIPWLQSQCLLIQFTYTRWHHIPFCSAFTQQYFVANYHITLWLNGQACLLHCHSHVRHGCGFCNSGSHSYTVKQLSNVTTWLPLTYWKHLP